MPQKLTRERLEDIRLIFSNVSRYGDAAHNFGEKIEELIAHAEATIDAAEKKDPAKEIPFLLVDILSAIKETNSELRELQTAVRQS